MSAIRILLLRLFLLVTFVFIASGLTSFGASSRSLIDDPTKLDRKVRLLSEARTYLQNNKNDTDRILRSMRESVVRRGGVVPDLTGNPAVYPSGKFTKVDVPQRPLRVGDRLHCQVVGDVNITAETSERFVIQLVVIIRHLETRPIAGSASMRVARGNGSNNFNLTSETQLSRPGRHEVLCIMAAHPINGGKPAILGVENSTFTVTKR
jgi:hypothetical protein